MKKIMAAVCVVLYSFTVQAMEEQWPKKRSEHRKSKAAKSSKKKKESVPSKKKSMCPGCIELDQQVQENRESIATLSLYMKQAQSVNKEQIISTKKQAKMNTVQVGKLIEYFCMREEALLKVSEDFYAQVHGESLIDKESSASTESSFSQYSVSSEGIDFTQADVAEIQEPKEQEVYSSSSPKEQKTRLGHARDLLQGVKKK